MAIQDPLTEIIIGCCFRVANELGAGEAEDAEKSNCRLPSQ